MIMETAEEIVQKNFIKILDEKSVKISQLGLYWYNSTPQNEKKFRLCYGNLEQKDMEKVVRILMETAKESRKR